MLGFFDPVEPANPIALSVVAVLPSVSLTTSALETDQLFRGSCGPAYAYPCLRFALALADDDARLGAEVGRYSFFVWLLHPFLSTGSPAHQRLTSSALC
jgi:hypothetical protein